MLAMTPTDRVQPGVIIGERILQLGRIRPKRERVELKTVDIGITGLPIHAFGGWQINSDLRVRDRRLIAELVANDVDSKTKFINQVVAENVCLRDASESAMQGNAQWKVEIVRSRLASGLDTVRIGSEGFESVRIGPEEPLRKTILAAVKVAIPIERELIIGELSRIGQQEGDRSS